MEEKLHRKCNDGSGKKMIYKMARERNEDSKDVKAGTVIKYRNGKLLIDWEEYFKTLLNQTETENWIDLVQLREKLGWRRSGLMR